MAKPQALSEPERAPYVKPRIVTFQINPRPDIQHKEVEELEPESAGRNISRWRLAWR